jgi:hypothetical protein
MNARAARRAEYEEADYARRQRYMLAAQASYAESYCPYGADCGMDYGAPAYYYPYAYGGAAFHARSVRHFPPHAMHRAPFQSGGRVAMHGRRSLMHTGGRARCARRAAADARGRARVLPPAKSRQKPFTGTNRG